MTFLSCLPCFTPTTKKPSESTFTTPDYDAFIARNASVVRSPLSKSVAASRAASRAASQTVSPSRSSPPPIPHHDALTHSYKSLSRLPASILSTLWTEQTSAQFFVPNQTRALNLSCGTGYFTRLLRIWGAASVLGADVSGAMITAAKDETYDTKIDYEVAEASDADKRYGGSPFDFALACWLLNDASTGEEMARMFGQAAGNLEDEGIFVALAHTCVEDPSAWLKETREKRPRGKGHIWVEEMAKVKDGVRVRVKAGTEPVEVGWDAYMLKKSVHEYAARKGGFRGRLKWVDCDVPEESGGRFKGYEDVPCASILIVEKS